MSATLVRESQTVPAVIDVSPPPAPPVARRWRTSPAWALAIGVGWLLTSEIAVFIQPDSLAAASTPLFTTLGWAMSIGLLATFLAAALRFRGVGHLGVITGGFTLAAVLACGLGGHVPLTAWWWQTQLLLAGTMTTVSYAATKA